MVRNPVVLVRDPIVWVKDQGVGEGLGVVGWRTWVSGRVSDIRIGDPGIWVGHPDAWVKNPNVHTKSPNVRMKTPSSWVRNLNDQLMDLRVWAGGGDTQNGDPGIREGPRRLGDAQVKNPM